MLTLFAVPRAFKGEMARIQRNAIRSWLELRPRPEIILCGEEEGVAQACRQFGLRYGGAVATSVSGAPVLRDVFGLAQRLARHDLLCYANADIILTADLPKVVEIVQPTAVGALVVCAPADMAVEEELNTDDPTWEGALRARAIRDARPPNAFGADVFVFPKGYFREIPDFFIGRTCWDSWVICQGCRDSRGIDATDGCLAIHQRHRGSTHSMDFDRNNAETARNFHLLRRWERSCARIDLPYVLTRDGTLAPRYVNPWLGTRARALQRQMASLGMEVLERTVRLRRRAGFYRWWRHPVHNHD